MDCSNTAKMLLGAAARRQGYIAGIDPDEAGDQRSSSKARTRSLARRRQRRAERRDLQAQRVLDWVVEMWHLPPECEPEAS